MGGRYYRAYILWLTFPPMIMMFLGEAGRADPRVRRPRRALHAVPRRHPALDPQHRPHPGRVAQQDLVEPRHGRCVRWRSRRWPSTRREAAPDVVDASARGQRSGPVLGDRLAHQLDECLLVERVALVKVDGSSGAGVQAGVEQAGRVVQCGAAGEGRASPCPCRSRRCRRVRRTRTSARRRDWMPCATWPLRRCRARPSGQDRSRSTVSLLQSLTFATLPARARSTLPLSGRVPAVCGEVSLAPVAPSLPSERCGPWGRRGPRSSRCGGRPLVPTREGATRWLRSTARDRRSPPRHGRSSASSTTSRSGSSRRS